MSKRPCNYREFESDIRTDFTGEMAYGEYLQLDAILNAQKLRTSEHDELLFVILHQVGELWFKLAGHELRSAICYVSKDRLRPAFKDLNRVKQVLRQLMQSWSILSTMTPVDYLKFRDSLGNASGFQSVGYRKLEFLLGNKNPDVLRVHVDRPQNHAELDRVLKMPSLYDEVIHCLHRHDLAIDAEVLERDVSQPYDSQPSVLAAWRRVYENVDDYYRLYELGEHLVDVEDAFQQWRFRHLYTVQRIIGRRRGTGGSSGVPFLEKALQTSFFPELLELRTDLKPPQ